MTTIQAIEAIGTDPNIRNGRPYLVGTSVTVTDVALIRLYQGLDAEEIDENLPVAVGTQLLRRGVTAVTVRDLGVLGDSDVSHNQRPLADRSLLLDAQKNRCLQRKTPPAPLDDSIDMLRPIVQHTGRDVRTVRPDNRAQIVVSSGLPEQVQITQWAKKGA